MTTGIREKIISTGQHDTVDGVDFSPEGHWCAVGSQDGSVKVFEIDTWHVHQTLHGNTAGVHGVRFSPDGKRLLIGSNGREAVKICDTDTWQEVATLEGQGSLFHSVLMSPDHRTVMAINRQGQLQFWLTPSWEDIEAVERQAASEAALPASPNP